MAQLRGKLTRAEEGMEDLLTSNVFGSFKYVPPKDGLIPFLARAVRADGNTRPLENLPLIQACHYEFWPQYGTAEGVSCEPDVLISIRHHDGTTLYIMIEAKFRSSKSSFPSDQGRLTDQLAREWDVLKKIAGGHHNAVLVFVTADYVRPHASIEESQDELKQKRGRKGNILWLSWRELPPILESSKHPMLRDLSSLMMKYDLAFFQGFNFDSVIECAWNFTKEPTQFHWACSPHNIPWCFSPSRRFTWDVDAITANWGFKRG